jgi:hypothetical protein
MRMGAKKEGPHEAGLGIGNESKPYQAVLL